MKPTIRVPYFEIGTKNYVYGDTLLEYALQLIRQQKNMMWMFCLSALL